MLKKSLNKYLKSEFSRNVLTLFSGTTIAQIIPFIISPILTRIYAPEDFGILALFLSVTSLISIIATLQYESAIVLPKNDKDAANLVALCLIITFILSVLTLVGVILFNHPIAKLLGNLDIAFWLYFAPIPVFIAGIFNTLNYWCIRNKKFGRLAKRTVAQSSTTAGTKLIFGLTGATQSGLIAGTLIGQFSSASVLTVLVLKDDFQLFKTISKNDIARNARLYKNFPKFNAWQGFFDVINNSTINVVISKFFGSALLGYYSLTFSLLQKPLQLIGNAVSQVFYQKANDIYINNKDLWKSTKSLIIKLLLLSVIIFTPIALFGPKLFGLVFGEAWSIAGVYARLLVPWMAIKFITSPFAIIANVLGKQKVLFYYVLVFNLIFPICFLMLAIIKIDLSILIGCSSIMAFIYYSLIIVWLRKILKLNNSAEN